MKSINERISDCAKKMGVPRDCVKILIEGQYGGPQHFVDPYKKLLFLEKRLGINIS